MTSYLPGLPEKCTMSHLFINYSTVRIKVGFSVSVLKLTGLGLVLVLICSIRTANRLSHIVSIDYKTSGMGSWQFCWGREVEAEAEARQGSNVLNRGKAEAESSRPRRGRLNSRQDRGEAERNRCCLCRSDIMHNAHVVVTCSCFVVNDIYQWKTLQRSFITNTIHTVIVL